MVVVLLYTYNRKDKTRRFNSQCSNHSRMNFSHKQRKIVKIQMLGQYKYIYKRHLCFAFAMGSVLSAMYKMVLEFSPNCVVNSLIKQDIVSLFMQENEMCLLGNTRTKIMYIFLNILFRVHYFIMNLILPFFPAWITPQILWLMATSTQTSLTRLSFSTRMVPWPVLLKDVKEATLLQKQNTNVTGMSPCYFNKEYKQ